MNISILGAGAWGTALGLLCHQNSHKVRLWGHHPGHLSDLAKNRVNLRHLPGVPLPADWAYDPDVGSAIRGADLVVLAVPSTAFRPTSLAIRGVGCPVVTVTKGIEHATGFTMCDILDDVLDGNPHGALSGPSLAMEVARGIPTAVVAASRDPATATLIQEVFHRPAFRVYRSNDVVGVETGGALKNVIAIAAGVCDGLGFGANSKAALLTRGLVEMSRLGVACGGRAETFAGLSGLGDLTVTCFSPLSRNRRFGERLGKGEEARKILETSPDVVEGFPTAQSARELGRSQGLDLPIIEQVYAMLYEGKDCRRAVTDLLGRTSKAEHDY